MKKLSISISSSSSSQNTSDEHSESNFLAATATLIKLGVGAGVVVLPAMFARVGLIIGILATFVLGGCAYAGAVFIGNAKRKTGLTSYEDICKEVLGPAGYWALNISLWMLLFLVSSAYIAITVEFMQPLMKIVGSGAVYQAPWFRAVVIGVMVVIIVPMLCLRRLEFLNFSNTLGVISIFCLFLLSLIATPIFALEHTIPSIRWGPKAGVNFIDILGTLGGLMSAFTFHHGICGTMDIVPKESNFNRVSLTSTIVIGVINLVLGVSVSILLQTQLDNMGDETYLDLFGGTGAASWMIAIAGILQATSVLCSLPLLHFIWRELTWSVWKHQRGLDNERIPTRFFFGHILLWFLPVGIVMIPGMNMSFLINFVGLSATSLYILMIPAFLQMRLNGGVRHYLSFGLIKSDGNFAEKTEDLEIGEKTILKLRQSSAYRYFTFAVCHFMLWFGLMEFGVSFKAIFDFATK